MSFGDLHRRLGWVFWMNMCEQTNPPKRALWLLGAAVLLACTSFRLGAADVPSAELLARGRRLYTEGITVAGSPVQARSEGDISIAGTAAACVTCHRPSGFGSSEGGYYVPPITGPILNAARKLDRARLFPEMFGQVQPPQFLSRVHQPHMRPPYQAASLKLALTQGIDAAGQGLALIMPRYQVGDADVAALTAYLAQLSVHTDPGVDAERIHFATVFSDDVSVVDREAIVRTMQAYVAWHNQHLRSDRGRPNFSPYNRSEFVPLEREWTLAVWTLRGTEDRWSRQLDSLNRRDPVFALIGGMVRGPWRVLARYCDSKHIPYILPNTELPSIEGAQGGYTVYFSAGLVLEAQVIAQYLSSSSVPIRRIVQLAAADAFGETPAAALRNALVASQREFEQEVVPFHSGEDLATAIAGVTLDDSTALVVWPGRKAKADVAALLRSNIPAARIFLPSWVRDEAVQAPKAIAERLRFSEPRDINIAAHAKSFEVRAWMRTRGIAIDRPALQFETYYALSLTEAALSGIRNDYYRDYLLERIERESERDLNPGIYPRLSFGPGQRFASKGACIVRLDPENPGSVLADSDWIVP